MTTTKSHENPFIFTSGTAGYERRYVEAAKVAEALAAAWGAELGECEPGEYGIGRVILDGKLTVYIRGDSRKVGRVEVGASCPFLERKLSHYDRPKFPRVSADTGKGIEALAKDLKRRVVELAAVPLAQLEQRFAAQTDHRASLKAHAEALTATVPALRVDVPADDTRLEANVSGQIGGVYVSARLSSSGSLSFDRLTSLGNAQALAVLAALAASPEA